jgi:hypothetical protein
VDVPASGRAATTTFLYLSPDAETELSASSYFPKDVIFVVGGLVDRRIKRGRSLGRAQAYNVTSVRLPIAACLSSEPPGGTSTTASTAASVASVASGGDVEFDHEPLNVDTVLEMLLLWKVGIAGKKLQLSGALRHAMSIHRRRHPNRTTHSGTFSDK